MIPTLHQNDIGHTASTSWPNSAALSRKSHFDKFAASSSNIAQNGDPGGVYLRTTSNVSCQSAHARIGASGEIKKCLQATALSGVQGQPRDSRYSRIPASLQIRAIFAAEARTCPLTGFCSCSFQKWSTHSGCLDSVAETMSLHVDSSCREPKVISFDSDA
jgi:hypothetical protein